MKKKSQFEFTRVLKLPSALGDWTTIQFHDPDEDVSIAPVVNINFDSFPKESLKKAHLLHYKFAERLVQKFSKDLNLKVELHTVSASQMPYGDFLNTQENKVVQADFVMPGLGRMNLILEWELADAIIDRVTGGKGEESEKPDERQFSDIELHMLHSILLESISHYVHAWSYVLKPEEISMEFVSGRYRRDRKLTLREAYVVFSFYIHLGKGAVKKISCAYPNTVLRRLLQMHQGTPSQSNPLIRLMPKTLKGINVDLVAVLGHAQLTMKELSQLAEGDIIPLDTSLDSPIEIQMGSENAFYAQPGMSKNKVSAQLLMWDGVSEPGALVRPSVDANLSEYAQAPLVEPEDPFSRQPEPVRLLASDEHLSIPMAPPAPPAQAPQYEPLDLGVYEDQEDGQDLSDDDLSFEEESEEEPVAAFDEEDEEEDDDNDNWDEESGSDHDEDEEEIAPPVAAQPTPPPAAESTTEDDDDDYSWDDLEDEF